MDLRKSLSTLLLVLISWAVWGQKTLFFEDFNAGTLPNGWNDSIVSGNFGWQVGLDGASINTGNQNLDRTHFVYFDDDSHGIIHNNNSVILESPVIDLSNDTLISLEFDYNTRFYSTIADSFFVDVFDGQNWINVMLRTTDDCGNYVDPNCNNNFPHAIIDVTSYASANFQIRFRYFDGNDANDWGWYVGIDNVRISAIWPVDLQPLSLVTKRNCALGASEPVEAYFFNSGYEGIDTFLIGYQIDSLPIIWDTIYQTIGANDSLRHVFRMPVDLSQQKKYKVKLITFTSSDFNFLNDTLESFWENKESFHNSFFDDFEDTSIVWEFSSGLNSWERGLPSTTNLDTSYSGKLSMVTNANGNYSHNENSYLISPCIVKDSGVIPFLQFQTNYNLEYIAGWVTDYFRLEYSSDYGETWSQISNGDYSLNWAGPVSDVRFESKSINRDWQEVRNTLNVLEQDSVFQIRFNLSTDPSVGREGVSIDDFRISANDDLDLSVEKIKQLESICRLDDSTAIEVVIQSLSSDTTFNYSISLQVNNGTVITDVVSDTILPFEEITHQFSKKTNFSTLGTYQMNVWLDTPQDTITSNDSLLNQVYIQKSLAAQEIIAPYYESFDSEIVPNVPGGWNGSTQWRTHSGPTLSATTGPNKDHTSGIGNYLYHEGSGLSGVYTANSIESECINLSNLSSPILSYWLHLYAQGFNSFEVEVSDGENTQQVDYFGSQIQNSSSDDFVQRVIDLTSFKGKKVKLKFSMVFSSPPYLDVAIDDIRIINSSLIKDVSFSSSCNSNQNVEVTAHLENLVADSLHNGDLELSYFVNNQLLAVDTINTTLAFKDTLSFTFQQKVNLNSYTTNPQIKVFAKRISDQLKLDSMVDVEIPNHLIGNFLSENFEDQNVGQEPILPNWTLIGDWKIIDENGIDPNQIPRVDAEHFGTKYINSHQVYNGSQTSNRNASLVMPCISIGANDSLSLRFKYHLIGDSLTSLYVVLRTSVSGAYIDTIHGASPSSSWQNHTVDLSAYAGQNVTLTIYYNNVNPSISNGVSIDMIQIMDFKQKVDARLLTSEVVIDNCDMSNAGVKFRIENNGDESILPNQIVANYQISGLGVVSQLVNTSIIGGDFVDFYFNPDIQLVNSAQTYLLDSWISLANDINQSNDSILNQTIINNYQKDSLWEDFESLVDLSCTSSYQEVFSNGWSSDNGFWAVQFDAWCNGTPVAQSGPLGNHTAGGSNFMYINPNSSHTLTASLISPCIELSRTVNPVLTYWYHMYGIDINTLYVESNASGAWQVIDSIVGQQQMSSNSPWLQGSIALDSTNSSIGFKIRFRSTVTGRRSNISIDDISIKGDSIVTAIVENKYMYQPTEEDVLVYPNPNNGQFYLYGNYKTIGEEYVILNLQGKQIGQGRLTAEKIQLNLNTSAKGIYFLLINKLGIQKKIIVY